MKATIQTPHGEVTATVDDGFIGGAEVQPDGSVSISFFPMEQPPDATDDAFINDKE